MKIPIHYLKDIRRLAGIKRRHYHPLIHRIHEKCRISKRTLFYIKEYGPHTNVAKTIIKESLKILLLASIVSSVGGLALEQIKLLFVSFVPLVILVPVLNNMVGDYGTIISSKFSTMLHKGEVRGKWWREEKLTRLLFQLMAIAVITSIASAAAAFAISLSLGYMITASIISKILLIILADVVLLVSILFLVAVLAGLYFFKKKEDPNNLLIPITTSIADFGNMVILAVLVILIL